MNRAIVTMTSEQYFPGTYILAKMLQLTGCKYPLRVYYEGRLPEKIAELENVEAREWTRLDPIHVERTKVLLELDYYCDQIMYLGSDCYPVADVSPCFDELDDALFWEDAPTGQDPTIPGYAVQGDAMLFDLKKCRVALALTHTLNRYTDRPDQQNFAIAWNALGIKQKGYGPVDLRVPHVFLHMREGKPLIVHRVGSKWPRLFIRPPVYVPELPCEAAAWSFFREINDHATVME